MLKHRFIFTVLFLLSLVSFGQRKTWPGYRVYSALISSSNLDTAVSIVILNRIEVEEHSAGLVEAIKTDDRQMIYFYTKTPAVDSATLNLIVEYYNNQSARSLEDVGFDLTVEVKIIDRTTNIQTIYTKWLGIFL